MALLQGGLRIPVTFSHVHQDSTACGEFFRIGVAPHLGHDFGSVVELTVKVLLAARVAAEPSSGNVMSRIIAVRNVCDHSS